MLFLIYSNKTTIMPLTLYAVSDGPPSLAVRQALKYLNLEYNHINVDFGLGEHMTDDFEKVSKSIKHIINVDVSINVFSPRKTLKKKYQY